MNGCGLNTRLASFHKLKIWIIEQEFKTVNLRPNTTICYGREFKDGRRMHLLLICTKKTIQSCRHNFQPSPQGPQLFTMHSFLEYHARQHKREHAQYRLLLRSHCPIITTYQLQWHDGLVIVGELIVQRHDNAVGHDGEDDNPLKGRPVDQPGHQPANRAGRGEEEEGRRPSVVGLVLLLLDHGGGEVEGLEQMREEEEQGGGHALAGGQLDAPGCPGSPGFRHSLRHSAKPKLYKEV